MLTTLRQTGSALKSLSREHFESLQKILGEQMMEARNAALDHIENATGERPDVNYFNTHNKEFKVDTKKTGNGQFTSTWRWKGKLIVRQKGKITLGSDGYVGEWTTESFA